MNYMDIIQLSMFQDHYKAKSKVTLTGPEARNIRINKKAMERKSRRMEDFAANRTMSDQDRAAIKQASVAPKPDLRKLQMQKWKEEKQKKKLMEPKKPPPFKAGVVKHPLVPFRAEKSCKHAKSPQACQRVTRSATLAQRLALQNATKDVSRPVQIKSFAPPNSKFHAPVINKVKTKYTPKKVCQKKTFTGILGHTPKKIGELSLSRKVNNASALKKTILNEKKTTIEKPLEMNEINMEISSSARRRSSRKKSISNEIDILSNEESNEENSSSKKKKRVSRKSLQSDHAETRDHLSSDIENVAIFDEINLDIKTTPPKRKNKRRSSRKNSAKIESIQKLPESPKNKMTPKLNKTPTNNGFATPYPVTASEESPTASLLNENLIVMSPLVTVSRGKGNSMRESAKRISFGYDKVTSPQKTAQYFRFQLDQEVARLQDMCDFWKTYENEHENSIPDDGKDMINLTIGQSQLLINKKLEQFRSLIAQSENGEICEGEGIITLQDLQGFWDMVYMQVENCDVRFMKLKNMRERNWQEEFPVSEKPKKKVDKPKPVKSFKASSGIKEAIKAARMKSKFNSKPSENELKVDISDTKTFNGGFFCVTSPVKLNNDKLNTSTRTPVSRTSLLKTVISSEANKKIRCTPHNTKAILKTPNVSKIAFNLDTSVSDEDMEKSVMLPIDLNKTPAKSILKAPGSSKVQRKSVKIISNNNSPMQSRASLISNFENIQLDICANDEEFIKSKKENLDNHSSPARKKRTRKIKRDPSINLISFESPDKPQTRSRRSVRNSILEKA